VSRPGFISPLAESRPTSPATTVVRALSPPTRLPLVVAAKVHRPMGKAVYNFVGGKLPVLLDDSRQVLTDVSLVDILTEPCVKFFLPVTMMGKMIGSVRRVGGGPGRGPKWENF